MVGTPPKFFALLFSMLFKYSMILKAIVVLNFHQLRSLMHTVRCSLIECAIRLDNADVQVYYRQTGRDAEHGRIEPHVLFNILCYLCVFSLVLFDVAEVKTKARDKALFTFRIQWSYNNNCDYYD